MITWGDPESSSLPLPHKLTTRKILPRPCGPQPSAVRYSTSSMWHAGSALRVLMLLFSSALRASELHHLASSMKHTPKKEICLGPAGLDLRPCGPQHDDCAKSAQAFGLAFPLCLDATRHGTPLYSVLRERIARGADFSCAPRPARRCARAPQRL